MSNYRGTEHNHRGMDFEVFQADQGVGLHGPIRDFAYYMATRDPVGGFRTAAEAAAAARARIDEILGP